MLCVPLLTTTFFPNASAGMVSRLDLDQRDDMSFVQDVAEKTFGDGTTNWGRITSLVAFGAVLSEHLKRGGRPECVETVAEQISSYLANKKYDWLRDNNGWVSEFAMMTAVEALSQTCHLTQCKSMPQTRSSINSALLRKGNVNYHWQHNTKCQIHST